jgi:hypothetical protein
MKSDAHNTIRISLAPGFSQVIGADESEKPFQRFLRAGCKPLKRFEHHTIVNTWRKPGANQRKGLETQWPEDLCGTTALTPALSPRRGRIVRHSLECRDAAVARRASCKNRIADCYSISPGERGKVRASVDTDCSERDGIHVRPKAIPKKPLERKLHEALRLARARLERGRF